MRNLYHEFCIPKAKKYLGFTLIELIVVIALIGILASYGFYSLISYTKTEGLQQSTQDVLSALQSAKSLAASNAVYYGGTSGVTCDSGSSFAGYGFVVDSSTTYEIDMICLGSNTFRHKLVGQPHTLSNNATFQFDQSYTYPVTFYFHNQSGLVDACSKTNVTIQTFQIAQNGQSNTITVSRLGQITLNSSGSSATICNINGVVTPTPTLGAQPTIPQNTPTPIAGGTYQIYDDNAPGWVNWSTVPPSNVSFINTSPVYSGSKSIAFSTTGGGQKMELHTDAGVNTSPFSYLHFMLQASAANQIYNVCLTDNTNKCIQTVTLSAPLIANWSTNNIPLSSLLSVDPNNPQVIIYGFALIDATGNTQPNMYVDDISLVSTTPTLMPPPPLPTPVGGVNVASDNFIRTNAAGFGTASDGNAWANNIGTNASVASVNPGAGIAVQTSVCNPCTGVIGSNTVANQQVLIRGHLNNICVSGTDTIGATLRQADANNYYFAYLDGASLVIRKRVAGSGTTISSTAFPINANTDYYLRFQVSGTTLSAKAWQASTTEPSTWTLTATDSQFSAAGSLGVRTALFTASCNATFTSFNAWHF